MVNLTAYNELKRLVAELEAVEDKLTSNELEMLHSLRGKYSEPVDADPFDITALQVMLRNIEIRKGYNMDVHKDPIKVVNMPSSED
jgi:hypothetical protein